MPITRKNGKYYWGSKGPFDTQAKAEEVAQAAYASGYDSKSVQKLMNFVQKEEPEEEDVDEGLADRMKGDEQTYYPEEAVRFPEIPTSYIDVADDPEHWRHSSPYARPKRVNIVDEGSHPSWETTPSILPEARAGIEAFPEVSGEPHSDTPGKWPTLTVPSKQAWERDEGPATPRSYQPRGGPEYMGRGNVKNSIQKLMSFVQKADDEPPKYHPVTGQRINAPTSGGKMGPNLTPSHIGGELEQQMFPDIHNWHDNIQSQAHLSDKERSLYAPGYSGTPKKHEDTGTTEVYNNDRHPMNQLNADGGRKDQSLLVDAELGHDKVDDERAGNEWVPGRFIGRGAHDGAYHQNFPHLVLDELYGRTHQGYNHGFNDLTAQMESEYRGEHRDVYSHHPHNEHLAVDADGNITGEIVNPLNGEQLNTKTYHGMGDDKSNRNVDNPILDSIPGSLTDSHKSTFGRKEGWAWNNHGLFQRAIKRGEKMRFSTWMLGFALGAEHINANNDVPYGFNSFGERISPSSHQQDNHFTSDLHRPVKWHDKDGQILENKPLLHYRLPHSMDAQEEREVRRLDTHFLPPGLQSHMKMSFLDDFGPMDIHQALDLIENPNHDVDPGRVQMTRIDPSTGAKIEEAFPRLRNPMRYAHDLGNLAENRENQSPGDVTDWDYEHLRHYFGNSLQGRLFGNFLPEQDPLSRYAQLQYHDGLRGLWNTENPETGGDVFTEEDYRAYEARRTPLMTGRREFPIRKAPYFVNPADPFGRGEEDKPSQRGGGYGDEVKDVLGSPNISSDPMAEFAPRGSQAKQPQFHRPWGVPKVALGPYMEERHPNVYATDEEVAKANQFQLKPPAPLKGGPGGHLAGAPLHHDNSLGTSDKREFDKYLHKLSNNEKMPSWEHWLGLVRGADYHNHNAAAVNNFTQDEAQYKRLGHWNRSFDEDRDMGILGQDRATESIDYPHIIINRGTIPRQNYRYHGSKTDRQLAPSEEAGRIPNPDAPVTSSGANIYEGSSSPNDIDFPVNSKWHHGVAIEPPENSPMYGIPWPFHNIRGVPKPDDEGYSAYGVNISQEDVFNPTVSQSSAGFTGLFDEDVPSIGTINEPEYEQTPITLREFLSLSGPHLQQGVDNHKFQGHPWVEGESPLTTDTTGEPGMLRTNGENKDWDNLLDARWKAWVSYLNHVLEHEQDPTDPRLQKLFQLHKEGAGGGDGGAFNGLSDTVFTSTNAGIFSPTYGGDKTQRRYEKRHKAQEKKRKKLLGKDKKNGVDRLVQYLYDGSPNMSKARKMGLAPGLDDDMTGDGATAHAWNNKPTQPAILNHKKTSRPLEDALKTAENNEPHINMGLAGGMETGITATYPRHSNVNSVGNAKVQRKAAWGKDNSYVQKAVNGVSTMISPTENKSADGPHPQQAFIERTKDNPNEAPAKDAVIKENDMQRRVKKYDDKASRRDGGQEQPAGSMAAAGSAGYPSGATMQMAYTSDYGRDDSLHRGGEEDMEDPEVAAEDSALPWVSLPEAEKVAKLEGMRKELEEAGDETPILNALLKVDYA